MSSFNQDFFDEILENEVTDNGFLGEEPQAFRQPYNPGGVIQNNFGEAFGDAPSSRVTASQNSSYPTSQTGTSLTSPFPEYGSSSGITVRQEPQPVPPGINAGAEKYMDTQPINERLLNHANFDLEFESLAGVPPQTSTPLQMVGIPGHDTQTAFPKMEELRMQARFLSAGLNERTAESFLNEEDMDFFLYHLKPCISRMVEKKRTVGHRISKQPAPKTKDSKIKYRCIKCRTKAGTLGALQRHVEDKHHPHVIYSCPELGCVEVCRKDKFRDHCHSKHSWRPTKEEMEVHARHLDFPSHCSICSLMVSDWRSFYQCFTSHCGISNADQNDMPSVEGESDIEDPDNGSNFAGAGTGGTNLFAGQDSHTYGGSSSQGHSWGYQMRNGNQNDNQNTRGMQRSSSDGNSIVPPQPNAFHGANQKRRVSVQDIPGFSRGFQQPGLPPKSQVKRPRQARAKPQDNRRCPRCGHDFSHCRFCQKRPVSVDSCHACSDTMRTQASTSSSQVVRYTAPSQGTMSPTPVNFIPIQQQIRFAQNLQVPRFFGNDNHQPPRHSGNHSRPTGNPQVPLRDSYDFTTNMAMIAYVSNLSEEEMLPTGSKSFNAGGTWLSCLPIRVPPFPMGMVKVPQKTKALEYGLGFGAIDQAISQTISEPINSQIDLPVAKIGAISPDLCRCPCRTKTAASTYSSNARVELISGKLLDMTLTILPEDRDRAGHPLRTRIRVVVKLLKLRSSVTRSGNKKRNKQDAKEIELVLKTSLDGSATTAPSEAKQEEPVTVDESDISESEDDGLFSDAESDTSSVAEASSVSELALVPSKGSYSDMLFSGEPSEDTHDTSDLFSNIRFPDGDSEEVHQPNESNPDDLIDEIQSLSIVDSNDYEIQETELEISLDLDLHTCLENLSNFTDGLADIEQSGHITDPARVFEYFFRYIIYVIFALSRSRIEAAGR